MLKKVLLTCFALVAIIFWSVVYYLRPQSWSATFSAVPTLQKYLCSIADYGIESCNFTVTTRYEPGIIPAPYDTTDTMVGSAKLSAAGVDCLRDSYEWQPIAREKIPAALREILPPGDVFQSDELKTVARNENKLFRHMKVVFVSTDSRTIFFIAQDVEHPLE